MTPAAVASGRSERAASTAASRDSSPAPATQPSTTPVAKHDSGSTATCGPPHTIGSVGLAARAARLTRSASRRGSPVCALTKKSSACFASSTTRASGASSKRPSTITT
jgi:hypothetical protein